MTIHFLTYLYGQNTILPYEPFEFEGYSPAWVHVVVDSSIIGESYIRSNDTFYYDGWSHYYFEEEAQNIIEYKGGLYMVEILFKRFFEGTFVQKLDINTGKVLWSKSYDFRNDTNKEWMFTTKINNDDELELIGIRELSNPFPKPPEPLWLQGTFARRKYDINTGEILYNYYVDEDESEAIKFPNFLSIYSTRSFLTFSGQGRFEFINHTYASNRENEEFYNSYKISVLNDSGYLDRDTIIIDTMPYMYNLNNKIYEIDKDRVLFYDSYFEDNVIYNSDSFKVNIKIYDKNLKTIYNLDLTKVFPDDLIESRIVYADKDFFILKWIKPIEINSVETDQFMISVYDYNGNQIEEVKFANEEGLPITPALRVIKLKNEKGILIVSGEATNTGFHQICFYRSDGTGNLTKIKSLKIKQKKHKLNLNSSYLKQLNNGDILLNCSYINRNLLDEPKAQVWIKFPADDLGIKSKTTEVEVKKKIFKLYPSPASDNIVIDFDANFTGKIEISDALGRVVSVAKADNGKTRDLDISVLSPGIYFVKAIDTKGQNVYKTGRFVKE